MSRLMLNDELWSKLKKILLQEAIYNKRNLRMAVEGMLDRMRVGCPWRDLPEELGHWHRTFVRFSCWREKGVWERVATALQGDADMEHLFIDSTIVRAHQHSAGAQKKQANRKLAVRGAD